MAVLGSQINHVSATAVLTQQSGHEKRQIPILTRTLRPSPVSTLCRSLFNALVEPATYIALQHLSENRPFQLLVRNTCAPDGRVDVLAAWAPQNRFYYSHYERVTSIICIINEC
jgi:hypothetical protein